MVVVGDFYVILVIAGLVDVFEQAPHIFLLLCVIGGVFKTPNYSLKLFIWIRLTD